MLGESYYANSRLSWLVGDQLGEKGGLLNGAMACAALMSRSCVWLVNKVVHQRTRQAFGAGAHEEFPSWSL